jgi:hypothetical protein
VAGAGSAGVTVVEAVVARGVVAAVLPSDFPGSSADTKAASPAHIAAAPAIIQRRVRLIR